MFLNLPKVAGRYKMHLKASRLARGTKEILSSRSVMSLMCTFVKNREKQTTRGGDNPTEASEEKPTNLEK